MDLCLSNTLRSLQPCTYVLYVSSPFPPTGTNSKVQRSIRSMLKLGNISSNEIPRQLFTQHSAGTKIQCHKITRIQIIILYYQI
ncbi:hypothetical protein CDL12_04807 [Handroanthus impetiginosus]|uniref:Uncharacterized protein n=1 Tax=Handroanthus impetiginosus TaxID=429701 RepID=A0A2G9HY98_9LAMI|nr:hypothetical protein CDL12_04807 [Handroanthus impetiginosus]